MFEGIKYLAGLGALYVTTVAVSASLVGMPVQGLGTESSNVGDTEKTEVITQNTETESLKIIESQNAQKKDDLVNSFLFENPNLWLRENRGEVGESKIVEKKSVNLTDENGNTSLIFVVNFPKDTQATEDYEKIASFAKDEETLEIFVGDKLKFVRNGETQLIDTHVTDEQKADVTTPHVLMIASEDSLGTYEVFLDGSRLFSSSKGLRMGKLNDSDVTLGSYSAHVREVMIVDHYVSVDDRHIYDSYAVGVYKANVGERLLQSHDLVALSGETLVDSVKYNNKLKYVRMLQNTAYPENTVHPEGLTASVDLQLVSRSHVEGATSSFNISYSAENLPQNPDVAIVGLVKNSENDVFYISPQKESVFHLEVTIPTDNTMPQYVLQTSPYEDFSQDSIDTLPALVTNVENIETKQTLAFDVKIHVPTFVRLVTKNPGEVAGVNTSDVSPEQVNIAYPGGVSSGLYMWLKADQIGENMKGAQGSFPVSTWEDALKSGRALSSSFAKGTSPEYIASGINSHAVVRFNAPQNDVENSFTDALSMNEFDFGGPAQQYTQFYIVQQKPTERYESIFSYRSKLENNHFMLFDPSQVWLIRNGEKLSVNKKVADGAPHIVTIRANEKIGLIDTYVNGISRNFTTGRGGYQPGGSFVLGQDQNHVQVGAEGEQAVTFDPAHAFTGDIAEVLYFHQSLGDLDRLKIESYLALKYGITLKGMYVDAEGKIIWDDQREVGYNNAIAGIGHDGISNFDQIQSTGTTAIQDEPSKQFLQESTKDILTIRRNIDAHKNEEDPYYLIWGSTKSQIALETSQISRTWFLQQTGNIKETSWEFNLENIPHIDAANFSKLVLELSPDESFKNVVSLHNPTIEGYIATFDNVQTHDGYFARLRIKE